MVTQENSKASFNSFRLGTTAVFFNNLNKVGRVPDQGWPGMGLTERRLSVHLKLYHIHPHSLMKQMVQIKSPTLLQTPQNSNGMRAVYKWEGAGAKDGTKHANH